MADGGDGGAMPEAAEDLMQMDEGQQASFLNEREVMRRTGKERINDFLRSHCCYDLLKHSGKVVVFDSSIPVQLAFYALVEHDMQAAPLWDSRERRFVGLMTVTDFIDILRHYRSADDKWHQPRHTSFSTRESARSLRLPHSLLPRRPLGGSGHSRSGIIRGSVDRADVDHVGEGVAAQKSGGAPTSREASRPPSLPDTTDRDDTRTGGKHKKRRGGGKERR